METRVASELVLGETSKPAERTQTDRVIRPGVSETGKNVCRPRRGENNDDKSSSSNRTMAGKRTEEGS